SRLCAAGNRNRRRARPRSQGSRLQEEASEAIQEDPRAPAEFHRGENRIDWLSEVLAGNARRGIDMAHKKGVGSSRNGRDSNAQRLGVKRFGGQVVLGG